MYLIWWFGSRSFSLVVSLDQKDPSMKVVQLQNVLTLNLSRPPHPVNVELTPPVMTVHTHLVAAFHRSSQRTTKQADFIKTLR